MRRHARSRRFVLRVSGGVIHLTIPTRARIGEALSWAQEQRSFIEDELADAPEPQPFTMGMRLPVLGQAVDIVPGLLTRGALAGDRLEIAPAAGDAFGQRVERCLRRLVLDAASDDLARYWDRLGVPHGSISVRAYRRRWGACGPDGQTAINWRLVFAPREVLRYVCAHEAAHRIEMNHSKRFWAVVTSLMPDHERHAAWLRVHGNGLSAFGQKV